MKARDFRARAREALQGNWLVACVAGFVASIFGAVSGYPSFNFEIESDAPDVSVVGPAIPWEALAPIITGMIIGFVIGFTVALILGSVVGVGYAQFNLDILQGSKPKIRSLFSRFNQTGRAVGANLLRFIRILGGMLLLIVPGIIASFKYSMIAYILAEKPELTAAEVLRESARIMKGNKWRLFCLNMSFIGWYLLVILTLGIAAIWVVPYEQAAIAAFYQEIKEN